MVRVIDAKGNCLFYYSKINSHFSFVRPRFIHAFIFSSCLLKPATRITAATVIISRNDITIFFGSILSPDIKHGNGFPQPHHIPISVLM